MNEETSSIVERLEQANQATGATAISIASALCSSHDGAFVVIVDNFRDRELSPRKAAFCAGTAAAIRRGCESPELVELALIDMVRKALANREAELLAAEGGDRG